MLAVRVPFLNQAIQGDDFYYLKGAEHAQIDPLHPTHARYVFLGDMVDMRGHPHPPLNAWYLALLVRVFGEPRESQFHAAYIPFSIVAALSAWAIATRFGKRPLLAAVLFMATPTFVVNGNSLESDLPFVAFWLAAIAAFVRRRWWLSASMAMLAALAAYQAVVLAPVLAWWLFVRKERTWGAWMAALAAPFTLIAWQAFERASSGALPATMLVGYMQAYNLQAFALKLKSAGALTGHMGWLVFPALSAIAFWRVPSWARVAAACVAIAAAFADPNPLFWISAAIGALIALWCAAHARRDFLAAWTAIFFAAALAIFFAGSARYLLPIVVPIAILVSDRVKPGWLMAGVALQGALSLGLAAVNYQHWGGYRQFARSLTSEIARHRAWTNAEWGLRHYLEADGASPIENQRGFWPGDLVITTAYRDRLDAPPMAIVAERVIGSSIPLRIVAPGVDSAYSSISFGLAPFGISTAPMDVVRAALVSERKPELSGLEIGTPQAAAQIVSGIYNNDRWTADRATVVLKRPPLATRIEAKIFIPPQAPARTVRIDVDGARMAERTYAVPGPYTIAVPAAGGDAATVTLAVDRTFSAPPDRRQLGVLLLWIGYR